MDSALRLTTARVPGRNAALAAGETDTDTDIDIGWQGHWLMVGAHGSINADTAAMLRTRLRRALRESPLIAVNLADAQLDDASGVAVLVGVHRLAQLGGKVFLVVAPTAQASQMLHVTGLDKRLLICPTFTNFLTWSGMPPGPPVFTGR
jgi:anti-sigma B factor antagonist